MNLSLILFASGGLYFLTELYRIKKRQMEEKKKIPNEKLFTIFDVALEDEDSLTRPLGLSPYRTTLKSGQYFPSLYSQMLQFMPAVVAASFGIMAADYLADKIRRKAAKKRLEKLNEEFDQLMNTTIELVKAKQEAKTASLGGAIGSILGGAANTILSVPVSIVAPGLSHQDVVNAYTMTIVPYTFWTTYEAAKAASPSAATKRAIVQYALQSRSFAVPSAASISALQKAIRNKYAVQKTVKSISSRTNQPDYSSYFKSKSPADESLTEHKNRLTIEEIYNLSKEQLAKDQPTAQQSAQSQSPQEQEKAQP